MCLSSESNVLLPNDDLTRFNIYNSSYCSPRHLCLLSLATKLPTPPQPSRRDEIQFKRAMTMQQYLKSSPLLLSISSIIIPLLALNGEQRWTRAVLGWKNKDRAFRPLSIFLTRWKFIDTQHMANKRFHNEQCRKFACFVLCCIDSGIRMEHVDNAVHFSI